jgi:hypothetical protein
MTSSTAKKRRVALVVLFLFLIIFLCTYRVFFYAPPLLDAGRRNIADKTLDFLWSGWHLTKGSFIKDYLKDQGTANGDFFKAGWYRRVYLLKEFRLTDNELDILLDLYRNLDRKSLQTKLYEFVMSDQETREKLLRGIAARDWPCPF